MNVVVLADSESGRDFILSDKVCGHCEMLI